MFESDVVTRAAEAGLPVARSHGVVTIDGRCGVLHDRVDGDPLESVLARTTGTGIDALAERFVALQATINATTIDALPDLVSRLHGEIARSGLPNQFTGELDDLLTDPDNGGRRLCHFDFHPGNVLVSLNGWVVIDWLTAASGRKLHWRARGVAHGRCRWIGPALLPAQREATRGYFVGLSGHVLRHTGEGTDPVTAGLSLDATVGPMAGG